MNRFSYPEIKLSFHKCGCPSNARNIHTWLGIVALYKLSHQSCGFEREQSGQAKKMSSVPPSLCMCCLFCFACSAFYASTTISPTKGFRSANTFWFHIRLAFRIDRTPWSIGWWIKMGHLLLKTQQVQFDITFLVEKVCRQKEFYGRIFIPPWSTSSTEFEIRLTSEISWRLYTVFCDMKTENVKVLYVLSFPKKRFAKEKNVSSLD